MSRVVKTLLRQELVRRLAGIDSLTVVSLAGVDGVANNGLRRQLLAKDIRVTVVKNAVARQALKEVGLESACGLIDGPSALATGGDNVVAVVRELLAYAKDIPALVVRGALMEGEVFGPDRVAELSRYPTRDEAIANLSMLARSPGGRLAGALAGPGARLAGIVKSIQERTEGQDSAPVAVEV